jgi:hypothetical protein
MAAAALLVEADGLVGLYRRSTLWRRVRTGRSMEGRLRGMQDRVNCLSLASANILAFQPASDSDTFVFHILSDA